MEINVNLSRNRQNIEGKKVSLGSLILLRNKTKVIEKVYKFRNVVSFVVNFVIFLKQILIWLFASIVEKPKKILKMGFKNVLQKNYFFYFCF